MVVGGLSVCDPDRATVSSNVVVCDEQVKIVVLVMKLVSGYLFISVKQYNEAEVRKLPDEDAFEWRLPSIDVSSWFLPWYMRSGEVFALHEEVYYVTAILLTSLQDFRLVIIFLTRVFWV
ncbi:BnaCnng34020D [Brassica napus]|uniref:BnaCnng34020D protein n=3 Tax=Brassica TaxID=3705 RepID=A0A078J0W5_BRANA|nr:BnaCnng34020D [Brassica napus]